MITMLTLSIHDNVARAAKKYAKAEEKSLPDFVENYLKSIAGKAIDEENIPISDAKLRGSLSISKNAH